MDATANGSRRAGGVPFQKDQLTKIFEILGSPNSERRFPPGPCGNCNLVFAGNRWPTINQVPEYNQLSKFPKWPRFPLDVQMLDAETVHLVATRMNSTGGTAGGRLADRPRPDSTYSPPSSHTIPPGGSLRGKRLPTNGGRKNRGYRKSRSLPKTKATGRS
jgi:hypothetical protein